MLRCLGIGLSSRRTLVERLALLCLSGALLAGCEGLVSDEPGGRRSGVRTAASACSSLPQATATDLINVTNIAYFEASYLSQSMRAYECGLVTGTILARVHATGQSYTAVITAPYQFEVYTELRLSGNGIGYVDLASGVAADQAATVHHLSSGKSWAFSDPGGYQACRQAVTAVLQNTPASGYYFFAATGNGTNSFNTPKAIPAGCNLLGGGAGGAAGPAEPQVPAAQAASSCAGICGYQSPQGCYCDAECINYGDCCGDYASACGGAPAAPAGCNYGTAGNHGDSCAGVAGETWRCVQSSLLGSNVSQVCRGGIWQSYHINPAGCASCCGGYSANCE